MTVPQPSLPQSVARAVRAAGIACATVALIWPMASQSRAQFIVPDPPRPTIRPLELPPDTGAPSQRSAPAPIRLMGVASDGALTQPADDPRAAWDAGVALLPHVPRNAQLDPTMGTLVLADGQRLRGNLQASGDGPRWKTRWLPLQTIRAEGTRAIILQGDDAPVAIDGDVVVLANGDRLDGIVTAIDTDGAMVERGTGSDRTETPVPWDRIRSISFVGTAAASPEVRVWLTDGSIISSAAGAWTTAEVLQLGPAPGSTVGTRVNVPRIFMLGATRSARTVSALAARTPQVSEASDGAGLRYSLVSPVTAGGRWPLDAAPLEIEGPVKLTYASLAGPATLSMHAALDPAVRNDGRVELVVRGAGRELHRARLDATTPTTEVRVDLPPGALEIELLAADGSAVGDVVRLERAVLIERSPT
jgi:hypothetical protein